VGLERPTNRIAGTKFEPTPPEITGFWRSNRWHMPCWIFKEEDQGMHRTRRIAMLAVVAVVAWAVLAWGDAQERRYSGTVLAVDRTAGAIIVGDMGPWRVKDGVTRVEPRTIAVTPSTELVRVRRTSGVAPSGWVGDFVESVLPGGQVKPGDWITVVVKADARRPTAIRIYIWEPTEG